MHSAYYVYAIVRADTQLPETRGGADLAMVPWKELAAVTGRLCDDGRSFTMQTLLRHEAIVEAVRRQGRALPVRFGTVFRDEATISSALAERYDPLAAELERLGDKVELSLIALWTTSPRVDGLALSRREEEASAGARYLHARAAELRRDEALLERARALAETLGQVLSEQALEQRVWLLPKPRIAVRTAYLLDPERVSAFQAVFDAVRRSRNEVHLLLSGPWPPYSFVTRMATVPQPD